MIRPPMLSGGSEAEQLRSLRAYLFQLSEQLEFALGEVNREQTAIRQEAKKSAAGNPMQTPAAAFSALKPLIIKSAEIVERFSEETRRKLEGQYVALSQFGTFSQQTEQSIRENSQEIQRSFRNIQRIETDLAALNAAMVDVNAYIKTGLLYYDEDGSPVYGVEIGQQTSTDGTVVFQKFARLTPGKLSFYDENDTEVAYISDYRLHITTADIEDLKACRAELTQLRMGGYTWSLGADGHYSLT